METSTQVFDFWDVSPEKKKDHNPISFKFQKEFLKMSQICQDRYLQSKLRDVTAVHICVDFRRNIWDETDMLRTNKQLRVCLLSYKTSEQWTFSLQILTAFLGSTRTGEKRSNAEKNQEAHIKLRQITLCFFFLDRATNQSDQRDWQAWHGLGFEVHHKTSDAAHSLQAY